MFKMKAKKNSNKKLNNEDSDIDIEECFEEDLN